MAQVNNAGQAIEFASTLPGMVGKYLGITEITDAFTGGAKAAAGAIYDKLDASTPDLKVGSFTKGFIEGSSQAAKDTLKALASGSIRATTRISETVCLYMPDTLNFDHRQAYNTVRPGGSLTAGVLSAGKSLVDTMTNKQLSPEDKGNNVAQNLSPFIIAQALKNMGDFGKIAFQASTGLAENPMMEMLYSSPDFRTFRFDFNFYPRSSIEAKQVLDIISCLRFHQAPEVNKDYGNFYLVPPSEFDISFYYNGKINPNIPQISTCVLEQINVNYAPSGFSTYEIPGSDAQQGGTGMPVSITLSLQFTETEIMTKQSYNYQDGNQRKTKSVIPLSSMAGEPTNTADIQNTA